MFHFVSFVLFLVQLQFFSVGRLHGGVCSYAFCNGRWWPFSASELANANGWEWFQGAPASSQFL